MGIERLKIFVVLGPKDSGLMFSNSGLSLNAFTQLVLSHQCTLHTYVSISKAVVSAKKNRQVLKQKFACLAAISALHLQL